MIYFNTMYFVLNCFSAIDSGWRETRGKLDWICIVNLPERMKSDGWFLNLNTNRGVFGATTTSLRTARRIWRMLDLFFHVSLEFRCQHIWRSHFEFNDSYKFNLDIYIHIYRIHQILNFGYCWWQFRAQLNFKQWHDSTISFCSFPL